MGRETFSLGWSGRIRGFSVFLAEMVQPVICPSQALLITPFKSLKAGSPIFESLISRAEMHLCGGAAVFVVGSRLVSFNPNVNKAEGSAQKTHCWLENVLMMPEMDRSSQRQVLFK